MKQIISNNCRRSNNENELFALNERTNKKSGQLIVTENKHKRFHFGYNFSYKYKGEDYCFEASSIAPKYKSLKEELLLNDFAVLNIDQYNNEYQKASIHFNSEYCKRSYVSYTEYDIEQEPVTTWKLSIEHLLSLMVYTNYTDLQYEFSKTYRAPKKPKENHPQMFPSESDSEVTHTIYADHEEDHEQFCHLGKFLKIAVHKFGTKVKDGAIKAFYRGMNEMLQFPTYLDYDNNVNIKCPLSTTSSMAVALNFANSGKGMIVEFKGDNVVTKYFSVDWLSDYPSEKEYLFIQNDSHNRLQITNIIDVVNGYEYTLILDALKFINVIIFNHGEIFDIQPNLEHLIVAIIHHRLSLVNKKYKPLKSLTKYAEQMIDNLFQQEETVTIEIPYSEIKERNDNYKLLFDELFHSKHAWIKIPKILQLFTSQLSVSIKVVGVDINESMFEDILHDLTDKDIKSKVSCIEIEFKNEYTNQPWIEKKYAQRFYQIEYEIEESTKYRHECSISRMS